MNSKTRLCRKPYAKTHESFGNSWNLKKKTLSSKGKQLQARDLYCGAITKNGIQTYERVHSGTGLLLIE